MLAMLYISRLNFLEIGLELQPRDGFKGLRGEPFKEPASAERKDVRGLSGFFAIAEYVAPPVTKAPLISVSSSSFNLPISRSL
jgi:hypothetical protein